MGFTIDGNAYIDSTAQITNINVIMETEESGYCTFDIINRDFTELGNIEGLYWTEIEVKDYLDAVIGVFEIKRITYHDQEHRAEVYATGVLEKFKYKKITYDQIAIAGKLSFISEGQDGRIVPKWDLPAPRLPGMTVNEYQNKFVSVLDKSKRDHTFRMDYDDVNYKIRDKDEVDVTGSFTDFIEDETDQSIAGHDTTVYNNPDNSENEFGIYVHNVVTEDFSKRIEFDFGVIADSTGSDVAELTFKFVGRLGEARYEQVSDRPLLQIYNYNDSSWETVFDFFNTDESARPQGGGQTWISGDELTIYGNGHSDVIDLEWRIEVGDLADGSLQNYLNQQAAVGGNVHHHLTIRLFTGSTTATSKYALSIYELSVTLHYNTDRVITYGSRKITSNTANRIVMDLTGITDDTNFPLTDNWVCDDTLIITETLDTIITDIWDEFKPSGSWDLDYTTDTDHTYVKSIENISFWEILKEFTNISGYTFYFRKVGANKTIICKEPTVAADHGGLIEQDDIVSIGPIIRDASKLRAKLTVIGSFNAQHEKSISPDHGVSYEEEYIHNADLISSGQCFDTAEKLAGAYKTKQDNFQLTIRYNDTSKDWSDIMIGNIITLTLTKYNLSAEEYLIKRIHYFSTGGVDYAQLFLTKWLFN